MISGLTGGENITSSNLFSVRRGQILRACYSAAVNLQQRKAACSFVASRDESRIYQQRLLRIDMRAGSCNRNGQLGQFVSIHEGPARPEAPFVKDYKCSV